MSRSAASGKGDEAKNSSSSSGSGSSGGPSSRHFAIYDVKGTKTQIRNIFDACERGDHKAVMRYAKERDFDVEAKDRYGRTALIWAADCGHFHICESIIRLNANINTTDSHTGRCAIHWAARTGSLPIVRLLIQYGANMNKEDKYGLTPLYLAKSRGVEGEEVFQYLLSEGAPYSELKSFSVSAIEDQIRAEMAELDSNASVSAANRSMKSQSSFFCVCCRQIHENLSQASSVSATNSSMKISAKLSSASAQTTP